MDTTNTKKWIDFPITVFVDTQVFIAESYDFSNKGKFASLKKLADKGKIKFLTSEIVKGEVERHITIDVGKTLETLDAAFKDRNLAILRDSFNNMNFPIVDSEKMISDAIRIFHDYLSSVNADTLDISDVDLKSVVSDYFSAIPPFGKSAKKKHEFPDAFNASLLKKYSDENGIVYVVSGDKDLSHINGAVCLKSLNALLDAINTQEGKISSDVKAYLATEEFKMQLITEIDEYLIENGYVFEVDGLDTDRKGYSSGYEYEEVELLSVKILAFSDFELVDIDYADSTIVAETVCKARLEFECSFFDEDNSVWDSEDKEYMYKEYGTIRELHNVSLITTVLLNFENDGDSVVFDMYSWDVDTGIELDQYTLIDNSRKRIDNPHSYWDDEDDQTQIINNPCPDCGREITFENDGGNGFCSDCSANH